MTAVEQVRAALGHGGMTTPLLMARTGLERHNVKQALQRLREVGELVTEKGNGHFKVHRLATSEEVALATAPCALQQSWRGVRESHTQPRSNA